VLLIITLLLGVPFHSLQAYSLLREAQRKVETDSFKEAALLISQAAEQLPWHPDLWEEAGNYALQGNDPHGAVFLFERGASLNCLSSAGRLALADAYEQTGNLPAAIRIWEDALQQDPLKPELFERLTHAYLRLEDYQAALAQLLALLNKQPTDAQLNYHLGLLIATQQPKQALHYLKKAAEYDPDLAAKVQVLVHNIQAALDVDDQAYLLLAAGRGLASLDEWELAAEAFRQATHHRPDYAEAWAFLGEALQHPGGRLSIWTKYPTVTDSSQITHEHDPIIAKTLFALEENGLPELQQAIKLDPHSIAANTFLALYWKRHDRDDLALDYLQTAIDLEPDNPALQVELGNTLAVLGNLADAVKAYQTALKLTNEDTFYLKLFTQFCIKYEYQIDEFALPLARQLSTTFQNDPESLDLMGQVLLLMGDLNSSEIYLKQALRIDPQYARAHLHLGFIYLRRGNTDEAIESFRLAYSLASDIDTKEQAERLIIIYSP